MAKPPRSMAVKLPSAPDSFPIGVRAPATMTASAIPCTSGLSTGLVTDRKPHRTRPTIVGSHERDPRSSRRRRARRRAGQARNARPLPGRPGQAQRGGHVRRDGSPRTRTPASPSTSRRCRSPSWPPTRRTWRSWRRPSTSTPCGRRSSSPSPRSASSTASAKEGPWAARHALDYARGRAPTPAGVVLRTGSQVRNWKVGRQGHRPLQLRRRPGPLGARRLDAGGQPAHLGLRDELRRPGRHHARQGQPAHAEAGAPELGGGGHQRAVQLDRLPHAGLAQRGAHEPGRQGARVGRQRRPRQLRRAARAQRRRHAHRRRLVTREGEAAQRPRRRGGDRPQGGQLQVLGRRAHPGRVRVATLRQGHPRPRRGRARDRLRAPRPPDHGRLGLRLQAGRHDRDLRGDVGLHDRVRQPPPLDEAQDDQGLALRQLPRGVGRQPADPRRQGAAAALRRLPARPRWARRPTRSTTTCTRARSACSAWRRARASASTTPRFRAKVGEDRITLFRRHGA